MPTGYTAVIDDDATFEQFVWVCARAFGTLVFMRDDSLDALVPEKVEIDPWYEKSLHEAKVKLAELERMTSAELQQLSLNEVKKARELYAEMNSDKEKLKVKYQAMLQRVRAWAPPTSDHEPLKKFMLDQIAESIRFDCTPFTPEESPGLTPKDLLDRARKSLERAQESYDNEVRRIKEANAWLSALRKSVPYQPLKKRRSNHG